jgi:hypothetical protein
MYFAWVIGMEVLRRLQARDCCNHGIRSRSFTPTFSIGCFRSLFISRV